MRAPVLAVGDGALGFWKALAEVFPEARHQRCWVHNPVALVRAGARFERGQLVERPQTTAA
ncbi:hypothetical protein GCM10023196_025110 [Actinoallomurus vinaceus]|uniref:Mutator family transposase n=1 Tax=Actinoallomurus vinaceus TaxID=1080074 RepID=A0ABP8U5W8_9ACTN